MQRVFAGFCVSFFSSTFTLSAEIIIIITKAKIPTMTSLIVLEFLVRGREIRRKGGKSCIRGANLRGFTAAAAFDFLDFSL